MIETHFQILEEASDLISFLMENEFSNILLGNGFSLAHPEYGKLLKWSFDDALLKYWDDLKPKQTTDCSEGDLNIIRIEITNRIIRYYINSLFQTLDPNVDLNKLKKKYEESSNRAKFIKRCCTMGHLLFVIEWPNP